MQSIQHGTNPASKLFAEQLPEFPATCRWVWHPELEAGNPGYVIFERQVTLKEPASFQLWYSADNRCNLRLNGDVIARGPGKSDLEHYYCAPIRGSLTAGDHIFQAEIVVWRTNFRNHPGPWSEVHCGGGWLVCGSVTGVNGDELLRLDTPGEWRCRRDPSRTHRRWEDAWELPWTLPCPPMEVCVFDASIPPWHKPATIGTPYSREQLSTDNDTRWLLVPRPIPALREERVPIAQIRSCSRSDATLQLDEHGVLRGVIPAGQTQILLDLGEYRTVFCSLNGVGGKGSCEVAWAESLFVDGEKQLRDAENGRVGRCGYADKLQFDFTDWRWDSFWFRSGRWVELRFDLTASLVLQECRVNSWHYPFEQRGYLQLTPDSSWRKIADMAWRTVLCCAHETYEDCPYWEQLQYAGDTRLQALISYAVTGDDRLARQAIEQFANSLTAEGLTQSRYPSNWRQIIPEFSLFWVLMVHDHYRYYADLELVRKYVPRIHIVLDCFERLRKKNGLIGPVGFWNITDWVPAWGNGKTDRGCGKPESLIALIYAETCRRTAELEAALAHRQTVDLLMERYRKSIEAVNAHCFDHESGFYRDVPDEEWYSSHVNCWAVLADALPQSRQTDFVEKILNAQGKLLAEPTLYFSAYLFEALRKTGMTFRLFDAALEKWRQVSAWHFDTFPETPAKDSRSDCHAWSAMPLAEMIVSVLGVTPEKPGFKTVQVRPMLLPEQNATGSAPLGNDDDLQIKFSTIADGWQLSIRSQQQRHIHIIWPDGKEWHGTLPGGKESIFYSSALPKAKATD